MTQEELRKQIDDLLAAGDRGKYAVDWTESLISIINQHVKEVIGGDEIVPTLVEISESEHSEYLRDKAIVNRLQNNLREEQRRRAELTK